MSDDLIIESFSPSELTAFNQRIAEMERILAGKLDSNPTLVAARSTGTQMATPTGISLTPNLSSLSVQWNPVASDLVTYYEIQFSTAPSFSSPVTRRPPADQPFYNFLEGDPGTTYYVRVRTFGRERAPSEWSETLNTATGLAASANLDVAAATNPFRSSIAIFDPLGIATNALGSRPTIARYDFPDLMDTIGGILLPFVSMEFAYACTQASNLGSTMKSRFYIDNIFTGDETPFDFPSDVGNVATDPPDTQAAGTGLATPISEYVFGANKFSVELELDQLAGTDVVVDPQTIRLSCVELRR